MTLDEIVQKIYAERYQDPGNAELATYMRDTMIREVAQRALDLATGGLAIELVEARRTYNVAFEEWMRVAELSDTGQTSVQDTYAKAKIHDDAEYRWKLVVSRLDRWITGRELE
jgi:hypothetical protein